MALVMKKERGPNRVIRRGAGLGCTGPGHQKRSRSRSNTTTTTTTTITIVRTIPHLLPT